MAFTVTDILAGVRRRAYTADIVALPDTDILAYVNEVVRGQTVPWIERAREEHFLTSLDTAFIASQSGYVMPTDCAGTQLFSLHVLDSSGNVLNPPLLETPLETLIQQFPAVGQPARYAIQGNTVVLWPTPSDTTQSLRFVYARRPSLLVARTQVVQITAISVPQDGVFRIAFTDTAPAAFTAASASFDLVRQYPGYEVYTAGVSIAHTSTTYDFKGIAPSAIQVGDYLCLYREAPVLTYIAEEFWPIVYQATVVEFYSSKGDEAALERAEKALARMIKAAEPFLAKRVTAAHRKIPGGGFRGYRYRLLIPGST